MHGRQLKQRLRVNSSYPAGSSFVPGGFLAASPHSCRQKGF
jgi:hypothetical protein